MTQSAGWCTNWGAYNVPAMWEMVAGEDDRRGWDQTVTWRELSDQVTSAAKRLAAARQALADKWPPENSEASAAFVAVLDELLASMTATSAAASSTQAGLSGIMQALASAKAAMEPLYKQWQKASNDLLPRMLDHAEDELNKKAQEVMARSERAVADYTPLIKTPPRFTWGTFAPGTTIQLDQAERPGLAEHTTGTESTGTSTSFGGPGVSAQSEPVAVPHDPPPPLPGIDPLRPDGPSLAGTPTPVTPSPGNAPEPRLPTSPGGGSPTAPGSGLTQNPQGPTLPPGVLLGPFPLPRVGDNAAAPRSGTNVRGGGSGTVTGPHGGALPPGGVIGGAPPLRSSGQGGTSAQRPATTPVPGAFRIASGHTVTVSGLPGPQHSDRGRAPQDPDSPWAVAEGVPPVIQPPPPPARHDPGPGVIGIDR